MGGKKESICKQRRMIKCRCSDAESHEYDEYIRAKKLASWGKKFGGKVNWRNQPFFGKLLSILYLSNGKKAASYALS